MSSQSKRRGRGSRATPSVGAAGYEGPGEGKGNTIVPRSFYGPGKGFDDRDSAWQLSDRWMTFLREKLPRAITFLYMPDEPNPSAFPRIRTLADNIHSNPGPGKTLPIFVTHSYTEGLDGAIDIWDAAAGAFRRRARGGRTREGEALLVLQRRPAVGGCDHHRRAGDRRPRVDVGGVQA